MPSSRKIAVIGLGYVGLPVAMAFGRKQRVIGFDLNARRIGELSSGTDRNRGFTPEELRAAHVEFTADASRLQEADFLIVTVPTPVDEQRRPDFSPLESASRIVGENLRRGASPIPVVVFESTVYPGATEEICIPLLEKSSGLRCGVDFSVGYSPERINPGDASHTFENILKVVSALDSATLETVASVYSEVVTAGIHKAPSIKVAEAAKVIENTQRDLNIALVNEIALILHRANIDTGEVLEAAGTKWNFLPFRPGLVGGHCLGVDPYYLTHKAEALGYDSEVILAGRRLNDGMGAFVAREVGNLVLANAKARSVSGKPIITVLGLTFKEDVPDLRNSKVVDLIAELEAHGFEMQVADPMAYPDEAQHEYGITLATPESLKPAHGVILAVAHAPYKAGGWSGIQKYLADGRGVVADIKHLLARPAPEGVTLWRL